MGSYFNINLQGKILVFGSMELLDSFDQNQRILVKISIKILLTSDLVFIKHSTEFNT